VQKSARRDPDEGKRIGEGREGGVMEEFVRVKEFLNRIGDRVPTRSEVLEIAPDLEVLYLKIERIRTLAPAYVAVDVSEKVRMLMGVIGKKVQPARTSPAVLRRAAGLL
jgi:hypothetical protein